MLVLALASVVLIGQTFPSATQKTGSWQFGTTKSSATHHTGYIPFEVSFPCTFDFVGPKNGCFVNTELDFDTISGGVYPFRGAQHSTDAIYDIQAAQVHLSGVGLTFTGSDGGVSHSTFIPLSEVYVDAQVVSLSMNQIAFFVHANLRDDPGTMVDNFQVWVSGEVVWSDGVASDVAAISFSCEDEQETCSDTRSYSLPYDFSGIALGFVKVADPSEGHPTQFLDMTTTVTPISLKTGTITSTCTLGGSRQIQCATRVIVVSGASSEMEPFGAQFSHSGSAFWSSGQFDQSPTSYELHREMACGLRSFSVVSLNYAGDWGGVQFGATATDCGFNGVNRGDTDAGTWSYGGVMRHGFLIDKGVGAPDDYFSTFVLDGNKLLWP